MPINESTKTEPHLCHIWTITNPIPDPRIFRLIKMEKIYINEFKRKTIKCKVSETPLFAGKSKKGRKRLMAENRKEKWSCTGVAENRKHHSPVLPCAVQ